MRTDRLATCLPCPSGEDVSNQQPDYSDISHQTKRMTRSHANVCVYAREDKLGMTNGCMFADQHHVWAAEIPHRTRAQTNQFVEFWSLMWHRFADYSGLDATVPQNRIQILSLGPGSVVIHQHQTRGRTSTAKPASKLE